MSEYDEGEERIKILALGSQGVGKTCFIIKYTENHFEETYLSTIGIDFKIKNININGRQYKLIFYDTMGQEKHRALALNIIKKANGIILMYDIINKLSFDSIPKWIESIREIKGDNFPMILCGNKKDLENQRKVSTQKGEELANEYNIEFFEISNKDGINVDEAGLCIVNKILEKKSRDSLEYNTSHFATGVNKRDKSIQKNICKQCC